MKFLWDGHILRPANLQAECFGRGHWNGIHLSWLCLESGVEVVKVKYQYRWNSREFVCDKDHLSWEWSRHFLVSKAGHGEWIMEGQVPPPVVMMTQILYYIQLGFPVEDKRVE